MSAKVFKMHHKMNNLQEDLTYSMNDFRSMDLTQLENRQFFIYNSSETFEFEIHSYYEIKKQIISSGSKNLMMLQFNEVSSRIRCDVLTGNQQMLQTINAIVSHEMRNPINSILCQTVQNIELAGELELITNIINAENFEECKIKLRKLSKKFRKSNTIQSASTKLLNFFVNDMLLLAQISEGKFRKECSNFDIRDAVKEIMLIQKEKADAKNINFTCEF